MVGYNCVNKDVSLFKVTILENKDLIGMVFSMSHVLADGYTFYKIYKMLD